MQRIGLCTLMTLGLLIILQLSLMGNATVSASPSTLEAMTSTQSSQPIDKADNITVNQPSALELVTDVPGAYHIEAMEVRDAAPNEIVFSTVWPEVICGQGNVDMWKLTLDSASGDFVSVTKKQTLSPIQVTRGTVGELSDGTLITGGGWCGTKPPHYSTDGGETWATANVGSVYPPNSTFSFVEFNGEGYVGTGYDPHHGEVYRWTGNGTWELAFDAGDVQNIVLALAEYQDQLFIGTIPYQHQSSCAGTTPVYVSSDGQNFSATEGIPGCEGVWHLLNVGGQLIARTRSASGSYVYLWDGSVWTHIGDWGLSFNTDGPPHNYHRRVITANGTIYASGILDDGVSQPGIYKSSDLGLTWESVVDLAGVGSLLLHDDTLYIGAGSNTTDTAHIYRLNLTPLALTAVSPLNATHHTLPAAPITATFNQAIDSGSVNSDTFALHGSQSQGLFNGSYTLNNSDLTVELAHSEDFMPGELLQATITTDTLSASGQPLTKPHVWQFRTAVGGGTGHFVDSGQDLGNSPTNDVALGDVDGDGDLDALVAVHNSQQANQVWLNDGQGVFIDSGQSLGTAHSTAVALGDMDGDGDLDVFIGNENNQAGTALYDNKVWLNDGTGAFSDSGQNLGGSFTEDVTLGDVDGDGDLDAFVVGSHNDPHQIWLNNGLGSFSDSGQSLNGSHNTAVVLGDIDGDGDLDAFVTDFDLNNFDKVWLNDGKGIFTDSGQSFDNVGSHDVVLGDIDADGDLDALVATVGNANKIFLNNGIGVFSDSGRNLGVSSYALDLADLDQDGDLDAFVTKYTEGNEVWENDGTGSFSNSGQSLGNSGTLSIALGDLDSDGDMDAFVGKFINRGNRVWLNQLPPSLAISKSASATAVAGDLITYTLNVSNTGPFTATNLIISDTLPTNASYVSGGTLTGNVVSWNVPTLAPTSTTTVQFVVTATQTITNSDYGVIADGGVSATGNTSVTTVVTAAPTPNLSISKSGPATAVAGDQITYTLTITNSGSAAATNLIISDTLPTNASYVSGGTLTGNEVSWNVPTLASNSTISVQFVVTASAGTITNNDYGVMADGGYSATGSNSVTTVVTTAPTPDLSISKSGPAIAIEGDHITYTLSITNNGSAAATNLIISDTLPTNASYVSGGTLTGNEVSWNVPTLAPNSTISVQFIVTASAGTITNSDYGVTADGEHSATGNRSVTTNVTPSPSIDPPNLNISKSGPVTVIAGDLITYTLTITNDGPGSATNLIISDTLPTNASYVRGGTLTGNEVSWNVPTLASNSTISVQFVVTASAGTITNSDYGITSDGGHSATGGMSVVTNITVPSTDDSLLAIYALSFDTLPTSDLSWAYSDAMQGLRTAMANDANKRALVLVDMPGDHNTFVYELQGGTDTLISGLPNPSGTLSSTIYEYDMTDGATLGGFLLWARNTYSADKTTFSYVGHGASLVPETDLDPIFDANAPLPPNSNNGLFPLPSRVDAFPAFTDVTPERKILSVHQLSEALRIGSNNGANPFDLADLVHCFAASIEEFYAVSPYAKAMTGSPNYAFFAPEMLGKALDGIDYSTNAHTIADHVIQEYDNAIEDYDDLATTEYEHPRLLVAVDSSKIAGIKAKWDEVSYYLWQDFDKTKIEAAYLNSAHYDTTYCLDDNGMQDWQLASPDAMVDLKTFATRLGDEFGSPVSVPVNTLKLLINDAITSRYQKNGVPWFANVSPQPTWNFDNHTGIGIYADFVGTQIGSDTHLSWHSTFYTDTVTIDNPHPYAFLQGGFAGTNWADVFNRYWQGSTNLQTDACLPEFPPLPDTGELAVTEIIFPQAATVTDNTPVSFMAAISTTHPAVDTTVAFTVTQSGSTVFTDVIHIPGLLVTGTHPVEASQSWVPLLANPTQAESFTLEVMVDHDNHVLEPDELNNVLTMSGVIGPAPAMPRPIITATLPNNVQWVTDITVPLDIIQDLSTSPPDVGTVEVQLYQYSAGSSPTIQVPTLVDSQMFNGVSLPQSLNVSLSGLNPGPVVLHVWAWSTGGVTVYPSSVEFNYVPPNTALVTGEEHYFLFNVNAGDALTFDLNALSGDPNMFIWGPSNFGPPTWQDTAVGSDTRNINNAPAGEYLLSVYGETGGNYTLSTTRNGLPYAHRAAPRANNPNAYVPESRSTFIEVIPEQPWPPTAITLDRFETNSRGSQWSMLLIGLLLVGLIGMVRRLKEE